jgi:hypothetical protein
MQINCLDTRGAPHEQPLRGPRHLGCKTRGEGITYAIPGIQKTEIMAVFLLWPSVVSAAPCFFRACVCFCICMWYVGPWHLAPIANEQRPLVALAPTTKHRGGGDFASERSKVAHSSSAVTAPSTDAERQLRPLKSSRKSRGDLCGLIDRIPLAVYKLLESQNEFR